MAIQHVNIPSEACHEPKHITNATTSDAGKVITPSGTVNGQSVLRKLEATELAATDAPAGALASADGVGGVVFVSAPSEPVVAYGSLTVTNNSTAITRTAAVDATFQTSSDFSTVLFDNVTVNPFKGVLVDGVNERIEILTDGVYRVDFWATVSSSVNSNSVAFNTALNGTVSSQRPASVRLPNSADFGEVSAHSFMTLEQADLLSLGVASLLTADITIRNARFSVQLIEVL